MRSGSKYNRKSGVNREKTYWVMDLRDLFAQQRQAGGMRVRESEILPQLLALGVSHAENLAHVERFTVRDAKETRARMLVLQRTKSHISVTDFMTEREQPGLESVTAPVDADKVPCRETARA